MTEKGEAIQTLKYDAGFAVITVHGEPKLLLKAMSGFHRLSPIDEKIIPLLGAAVATVPVSQLGKYSALLGGMGLKTNVAFAFPSQEIVLPTLKFVYFGFFDCAKAIAELYNRYESLWKDYAQNIEHLAGGNAIDEGHVKEKLQKMDGLLELVAKVQRHCWDAAAAGAADTVKDLIDEIKRQLGTFSRQVENKQYLQASLTLAIVVGVVALLVATVVPVVPPPP